MPRGIFLCRGKGSKPLFAYPMQLCPQRPAQERQTRAVVLPICLFRGLVVWAKPLMPFAAHRLPFCPFFSRCSISSGVLSVVGVWVRFVHNGLDSGLNPITNSSIAREVLTDCGNLFGVDHLKALVFNLSWYFLVYLVSLWFRSNTMPFTGIWYKAVST